ACRWRSPSGWERSTSSRDVLSGGSRSSSGADSFLASAGRAGARDLRGQARGDVRLRESAERGEDRVAERRADDDALEDALAVRAFEYAARLGVGELFRRIGVAVEQRGEVVLAERVQGGQYLGEQQPGGAARFGLPATLADE